MKENFNNFKYKLIICIISIFCIWLIHFNMCISQVYENEIETYKNIIEYEQSYKTKSINVIYRLIDKKTLNNEVENYERTR